MATLRVGNAPCSWGRLEFEEAKGEQIGVGQMLDELAATGYTGTELGDWGYMPTAPALLKHELEKRGLVMLGAFVPVALKDPAAHEAGVAHAQGLPPMWPVDGRHESGRFCAALVSLGQERGSGLRASAWLF